MYQANDAAGSLWPTLYFFLLIVFGAMFAINLIIAVIYDSYERKAQEVESKIIQQGEQRELDDLDNVLLILALLSSTVPTLAKAVKMCYDEEEEEDDEHGAPAEGVKDGKCPWELQRKVSRCNVPFL